MADWTPDQRKIMQTVQDTAEAWQVVSDATFPSAYQGVFLCGAVGAGKTSIVRAMFPRAAWFDAPDIGKEATSAMHDRHGGRTAYDMLDAVKANPVTVIDEIGRWREGDHYGRDVFWSLLNGCLNRRRFFVGISNQTVDDVVKSFGGGEGLASRFALLRVVAFPASMPDFRRRPHADSEAPRRVFEGARK